MFGTGCEGEDQLDTRTTIQVSAGGRVDLDGSRGGGKRWIMALAGWFPLISPMPRHGVWHIVGTQ